MSFHEVRLPVDIERGARGGPGFKTTVTVLASGHEQRNGDWQQARGRWDIGYGVTKKERYSLIDAFFRARRGRLFGFRFKDWADYEAQDELVGVGDATQTKFQAQKVYADVAGSYSRYLHKLVDTTLVLRVDGVETAAFTVDNNTGVITMDAAPGIGVEVRIDVEFDVPVRFDEDDLEVALQWVEAGSVPNIQIIELRQKLESLE